MKKIAFLTDNLLSIGGVQRVLAVIAIALSKENNVTIITMGDDENSSDKTLYGLDKSEVLIRYFHPDTSKRHRLISGLYKQALPKCKLTSEIYARSSFPQSIRNQFIQELNKGKYDTIIAVHGGLSIKLASIRNHLNANRVIGWMHNSYQAFFTNTPCYYPYLENHFKHQLKKLDDFVVLTKTDANEYITRMGLHPSVIYNPLTLMPGEPSPCNQKRFLSIGRMTPLHKGFDILIDAFAIFAKNDKEWTLEIVGEGPEENNLRKKITNYNLEKRIIISPFTKDIQKHYSKSSIFVLASRWEGFGLVIVEALSHGLPIIASNLPAPREILTNEVASFFTPGNTKELAHAMAQTDNILRQRFKTIEHAKTFSVASISKKWSKLL